MKESLKKDVLHILGITLAALINAININTFVHTGGLFPGGATGFTVLLQRVGETYFGVELPYSAINLALNAFPVYIGLRFIGKKFTLLSVYMIFMSGLLTDLLPSAVITYDTLLIAIFGGIINGTVISICLHMSATSGGTDFIAIFLSERKGIDSFNVVLTFNIVLLGIAGALFGWNKALYSIIFQYVSTQIVHTFYNRYQQQTLFIVTDHADEVCGTISAISRHGATIMRAEGAYSHEQKAVVYSVVSRGEYKRVIRELQKVDAKAFINSIRTDVLAGRFYRAPTE